MAEQPMLRDVIDIKQSISTSDFVLRLAEAVTEKGAEAALRDYVVTERLLDNFAEALGLIKSALDGHTSKAVYLHGSFGSGKSHFMAVLYALLSGNQAALSRSEFDPVLTRHEWLTMGGKKFLLVPYHMLGAKALEQRVLGEYVKHVRALHPDAPIPQVYRTDTLFADLRDSVSPWGTRRSSGLSSRLPMTGMRRATRTSGVSRSPGRPPCWTPRWPPRSTTRTPRRRSARKAPRRPPDWT